MKRIMLLLSVISTLNAWSQDHMEFFEGFESSEYEYNYKGTIVEKYGRWYDGGSGVSSKEAVRYDYGASSAASALTKMFVYSGDYSLAFSPYTSTSDGVTNGSLHTGQICMNESLSSITVDFKWLVVPKGNALDLANRVGDRTEKLILEASADNFETYITVKTINIAEDDRYYLKNPYYYNCEIAYNAAKSAGFSEVGYLVYHACVDDLNNSISDYYKSESITLSVLGLFALSSTSDCISLRLRSDFNSSLNYDVYIDELDLTYTEGGLSELDLEATNTTTSLSKTLYNFESFEVEENAAWGIWNDGGADAYQTTTYPSPTAAEWTTLQATAAASDDKATLEADYDALMDGKKCVAIRGYYDPDWLEDQNDEFSGEKPTYSGIVTQSLDLTEYSEIELNFSFVSIGMVDGYGFDVMITRDAGISWTTVKSYIKGKDFLNNERYADVKLLIKNSDFEDWTGTAYDYDGFTTTTQILIQCQGVDESTLIYLDNVAIYTAGSSGISYPANATPNWSNLNYKLLNSDGDGGVDTYDLVNQVFHPDGTDPSAYELVDGIPGIIGAVEHSDCSHIGAYANLENGITEVYDAALGKDVFSFNMNLAADTDRCKDPDLFPYKNQEVLGGDGSAIDRQRVEVKTYSASDEFLLGHEGDTHMYAWKMKLSSDFQASDMFTHLHQLKSKNAVTDEEGKPLITLTAGGAKYDETTGEETTEAQLRIRYSPAAESQINLAVTPLAPFLGQWVTFVEKITHGEWGEGRYHLIIVDESGTELLNFKSNTLRMWKTDASFIRAKWGIYRSLLEPEKLKDETLLFSDILAVEVNDEEASIEDFLASLGDFGDTPTTVVIGTGDGSTTSSDASSASSTFPDPDKTYYMDARLYPFRYGANGGESAYGTDVTATGSELEWQFTPAATSGYYYIDCVGAGSVSRLRSDQSTYADMEASTTTGDEVSWSLTDAGDGYYYLSTEKVSDYMRLSGTSGANLKTVVSSFTGTSTHFMFTEAGSSSARTASSAPDSDTESLADESLKIYPNPASGSITVLGIEEGDIVNIYGILGNLIMRTNSAHIDISLFRSGVYFVETNGQKLKFIKN